MHTPKNTSPFSWLTVFCLGALFGLWGTNALQAQTCQATIPNFNSVPSGLQTGCVGSSYTFMTRIDHVTGFNLVYPNGTMTWYPHNGAYSANFNSISIPYQAGWSSAQFEIRAVSCGPAAAISSRYFYLTTRAATAVTTQPANAVICPGANGTFTVATNAGAPAYQWLYNGTNLSNGGNISGATSNSLTVTGASSNDFGNYSCVITSGSCPTYAAVTTTNATMSFAPVVSVTPASATVCTGQSSVFTCSTSASYLWSNGATTRSITPTAAGIYTVTATTSGGCTSTASAELIISTLPAAVVQSPSSQSVCAGNTAVFTSQISNALTYQWRKNGVNIAGATNSNLTITNVQASDAGTYSLVATACGAGATTTGAVLTVNALPIITQQPTSMVAPCAAVITGSVTFTVSATNATSYQWTLNGTNITNNAIFSGATTNRLTLSSSAQAQYGTYRCIVGGTLCSITSNPATLGHNNLNRTVYYAFENNASGTDGSGNGRNCTVTSQYTTRWTLDRFGVNGNAWNVGGFVRNINYATMPSAAYFGNSFTVATWVDARRSGPTTGGIKRLFDIGGVSLLFYGNTEFLYIEIAGTTMPVRASAPIPTNVWSHIVWAQTGTIAKIYLNGELINTIDMGVSAPTAAVSGYLGLGRVGEEDFGGLIDEFSIYNRELAADEVVAQMSNGFFTQEPVSATTCLNAPDAISFTSQTAFPSTYVWHLNNATITNSNSNVYTIPFPTTATQGIYRVSATNACGTMSSRNATLSVLSGSDLNTNLTFHYPLDVNVSTTVSPAAGNISYTNNRFGMTGTAARLSNNGHLRITTSMTGVSTSPRTYSTWFNTTATNQGLLGATGGVAGSPNTNGYVSFAYIDNAGILRSAVYNGSFIVGVGGTTPVNDGQWHHVAWSYDGSTQYLYIDGVLVGSSGNSTYNDGLLFYFHIGAAQLGGMAGYSGTGTNSWEYFNGSIDDVRLYRIRRLNDADILALYQEGTVSHPRFSVSQCENQTLTLTAQTSSTDNINWLFNGNALGNGNGVSGANTNTLSIANYQASNAGNYTLAITTAGNCSAFGTYNTVTVTSLAAPNITVSGVPVICNGGSTVLTASGASSYVWSTGSTNAAATITTTGVYTVTGTGSNGCVGVASVTVTQATGLPAISQQPVAQNVCLGRPLTLSVAASNLVSYQWRKAGVNIAGATNSSLSIANAQLTDAGAYDVVVVGCSGNVTSTAVNVTVQNTDILLQPISQVIACAAAVPVSFTVQAASTPVSYRWRFNGNNITNNAVYSGATSATLTVSSGTAAEFGVYDCVITFSCGSVTSSTATLSSILTGATLNLVLNNNLTDASGNARNGTGTVSYIADRKGVASSAVSLNGTAAQYVTVPAANYFGNGAFTAATWVKIDAYTLYARLFDFGNGPGTNNVIAYINASGIINVTYFNGTTGSSTLATPNAVPLNTWTHFAWVQSGTDAKLYINGIMVANQPNMVQAFPNVSRNNCYIGASNWTNDPRFTGAFDDFIIADRVLSASEIVALAGGVNITQQPVSASSCSSQPVTLSVVAPTALTYQWQLNGLNIPNATSSTYTANGTQASYGVYRVSLTSTCGSGLSNNATVSAGAAQDITTGLYAHYKMNGSTLDASGNNRTATGITPTYTTDRAGTNGFAGNFTGTQYLSLPAAPFMLNTASKTYSVWFKTTATNVPLVGLARAAVNGTNLGYYCYMHVNNNGKLDGGTYNGGFRTITPSTASVNDGQWHHALWTNGGNTQYIYLDGVFVASVADGSTLASGSLYFGYTQVSGYPNFVGTGNNGWVGFNGQMDDARIYDRSLSTPEVAALYQEALINFAQTTASTCAGQSLTLAPQVYNGGSNNYAWTFNGANATNGNGISGVNTNTLNITNATSGNAGTYNLVVTSNSCNTFSGTPVTVTLGNAPSITTQPQNRTVCPGGNTSFGITATNVTSYQWRRNGVNINGAVNATLNITNAQNANVGNYDVLMTSACGTLTSNTVTLALSASAPSITSANTTITCAQNSVSLTATAGNTYRWSNNQTTQAINVTAAGTYTVTVTDASSCTGTTSVTVTSNLTAPTVSIAAPATITCAVPQVTLTASGNATSYAWTGGPATATRTVTAAGTYTVVATGANGCTGSASVSVSANLAPPTVSIAAPATITCVVPQVTLTASGNATSYAWTGGPATATRTVTAAGTFTVLGTNAAGCTASASVSVSANTTAPNVSIATPAIITCVVPQVTLTASGNATSYAWVGGPATATRTVTSAGTYTVVATAANGCTASSSATVTSSVAAPTVSITTPATITCAVPQVTLTASGNATSYAWTSGPATATRTVTAAGTYSVVATGANGCSASASVNVSANTTAPTAAVSPNNVTLTCVASSANLTASGGTSYLWSNGQTTATISVAAANTYRVTVTGANGCTSTGSATVTAATGVPQVVITPTAQQLNCAITAITLTASGANSYAWTGGPTTATRTVTAAGTYAVVGTNSTSGCTASTSVNITRDITAPAVTIATPAQLTCATTQVTLTANGAVSYAWVGGPATATRIVTAVGAYTVVGTGANGCTANQVVTVTSNTVAPPTAAASVNQSATNANFPAVITISGYNPNLYSYRLLNFTTNALVANMNGPTVTNTTGGVFKVEITSLANGCVSYSNRIKVIYDANFGLVIGTVSIPGSVNRPAGGKVVSEDFGTNATPVSVYYDMHVYPNPASDYLNINYEFEQETEAQFSLYSADGRMVWEQKTSAASNLLQVNVADIPSGQYFLRMSSQSLTKTVLVQVVK